MSSGRKLLVKMWRKSLGRSLALSTLLRAAFISAFMTVVTGISGISLFEQASSAGIHPVWPAMIPFAVAEVACVGTFCYCSVRASVLLYRYIVEGIKALLDPSSPLATSVRGMTNDMKETGRLIAASVGVMAAAVRGGGPWAILSMDVRHVLLSLLTTVLIVGCGLRAFWAIFHDQYPVALLWFCLAIPAVCLSAWANQGRRPDR